jgi:hypothetical protein
MRPKSAFFYKETDTMRKLRIAAAFLFVLGCGLGSVVAAEGLKSGPQNGEKVPGPFHVMNVTGESAGEKACLYCKNGEHPVAMIFAREVSQPVTMLIKKIDAATAEHKDAKMGSFVVFLAEGDAINAQLKDLAEKEQIHNTVLAIDSPTGPEAYKVAKDADVTVVLYTKHEVKSNRAFQKGELQERDIDAILADLPKILPQQ